LVVVPFTSGQISISYSIDAGSFANQTGITSISEPSSHSLLVLGGVLMALGSKIG